MLWRYLQICLWPPAWEGLLQARHFEIKFLVMSHACSFFLLDEKKMHRRCTGNQGKEECLVMEKKVGIDKKLAGCCHCCCWTDLELEVIQEYFLLFFCCWCCSFCCFDLCNKLGCDTGMHLKVPQVSLTVH